MFDPKDGSGAQTKNPASGLPVRGSVFAFPYPTLSNQNRIPPLTVLQGATRRSTSPKSMAQTMQAIMTGGEGGYGLKNHADSTIWLLALSTPADPRVVFLPQASERCTPVPRWAFGARLISSRSSTRRHMPHEQGTHVFH
jgi:hypothetical protein